MHAFFFDNQKSESKAKIPIFYCEYSQKRGPAIANALRKADRERNVSIYPRCSYEEMYVLDKGYKRFYEYAIENTLNVSCWLVWYLQNFLQTLCEPSDYVPMDHPDHLDELRKHQEHKKNKGNKTVINHMWVKRSSYWYVAGIIAFQVSTDACMQFLLVLGETLSFISRIGGYPV